MKLLPFDDHLDKIQVQKAATPVDGRVDVATAAQRLGQVSPNAVVLEKSGCDEGDINKQRIHVLRDLTETLGGKCRLRESDFVAGSRKDSDFDDNMAQDWSLAPAQQALPGEAGYSEEILAESHESKSHSIFHDASMLDRDVGDTGFEQRNKKLRTETRNRKASTVQCEDADGGTVQGVPGEASHATRNPSVKKNHRMRLMLRLEKTLGLTRSLLVVACWINSNRGILVSPSLSYSPIVRACLIHHIGVSDHGIVEKMMLQESI